MKTLVLVRHAKSSWDHPGLDDHDRPLNARGEHDAPRMAHRFAARGLGVDLILSSTALRARTTAAVFGEALGVLVELDERLYGAAPSNITALVGGRGADRVLVVAHDPGLSILAGRLEPEIAHMPTCAVAGFTWGTDDWAAAFDSAPDDWWFDAPRLS